MPAPLRIAVLASGRGSNFQALLDARAAGRLDAEFVGVFSDRPAAPVLARARAAGVPAWTAAPSDYPDRSAFDAALFDALAAAGPQLVVMAGYMRIVADAQVARWRGRMVNIHPSLLPRWPGLRTHARALAAGDREHGATVHFVTPELDAGPAIAQARVPVRPGDDAATLQARVLAREHPLLVASVAEFAAARVALDGERVRWCGAPLDAPLVLDGQGQLRPAGAVPPG